VEHGGIPIETNERVENLVSDGLNTAKKIIESNLKAFKAIVDEVTHSTVTSERFIEITKGKLEIPKVVDNYFEKWERFKLEN
jgi:hypothetical protein